ncbi:hypothetical protein ALP52_02176 [Pseudomonas amygdali pv. mori]|uniref:Uncharacterized protein n=1 Tax=Pseudomonas amygdali pv. mori TaxID=34065 RepID=A0A3M5J5W9_PSEA0|nr:hypothetical protein ALP52_02176 [Pseudomonas amygdali pv. mori]
MESIFSHGFKYTFMYAAGKAFYGSLRIRFRMGSSTAGVIFPVLPASPNGLKALAFPFLPA